jgi:hypothetical protein
MRGKLRSASIATRRRTSGSDCQGRCEHILQLFRSTGREREASSFLLSRPFVFERNISFSSVNDIQTISFQERRENAKQNDMDGLRYFSCPYYPLKKRFSPLLLSLSPSRERKIPSYDRSRKGYVLVHYADCPSV